MNKKSFINILIAEDNDVSRDMMVGVLNARDYNILEATDGGSAIEILQNHDIDLALVDLMMSPTSGEEFVKHLVVQGLDIPVIVITANDSSDVLLEMTGLGVAQVIQKPIDPDRLLQSVERVLRRRGVNLNPLNIETHKNVFTPEELMRKTIEIATQNAESGKGRPYGAIVSDAEGRILGEGTNGRASRVDPTAHAEVMAIRKAAEKLGKTSLEGCVLYCSSQPTRIGQALIEAVAIDKVYYGLTHKDIEQFREPAKICIPDYEQICRDEALEMFTSHRT